MSGFIDVQRLQFPFTLRPSESYSSICGRLQGHAWSSFEVERCKRNSLNLACPVKAQQESALSRWIDRRMVLDYCRAVALWHKRNTFNHHAPSCAVAFSRRDATHVGSCALLGPAFRSSSTPRLARAL